MRQAQIPIEALIEYVSLFQKGDSTRQTRKEILLEQRRLCVERLAEMQKTLERLDAKIADYDTAHFEYERKLEEPI
jgi:DNA-binding transcriptional MerR regulator